MPIFVFRRSESIFLHTLFENVTQFEKNATLAAILYFSSRHFDRKLIMYISKLLSRAKYSYSLIMHKILRKSNNKNAKALRLHSVIYCARFFSKNHIFYRYF